MGQVLKQEIVERIKNDGVLFGKVADALYVKPVTLPRILIANHTKLTRVEVMKIIKKHLGISEDSDLLEPVTKKSQTAA